MLKKVKFVGIPVRDQEKALQFWVKKIGLQISTDQPMGDGMRWIELKVPGAQTGLVLFTPPGRENRIATSQNLSFSLAGVDKPYRELDRGVSGNLDSDVARVKEAMGSSGVLWICYPKARGLGTDLNRDVIRRAVARFGLEAVAIVTVDRVWSAMRCKRVR